MPHIQQLGIAFVEVGCCLPCFGQGFCGFGQCNVRFMLFLLLAGQHGCSNKSLGATNGPGRELLVTALMKGIDLLLYQIAAVFCSLYWRCDHQQAEQEWYRVFHRQQITPCQV